MKKYNTPEIETLALETIDVIATSGNKAAEETLKGTAYEGKAVTIEEDVKTFTSTWSW